MRVNENLIKKLLIVTIILMLIVVVWYLITKYTNKPKATVTNEQKVEFKVTTSLPQIGSYISESGTLDSINENHGTITLKVFDPNTKNLASKQFKIANQATVFFNNQASSSASMNTPLTMGLSDIRIGDQITVYYPREERGKESPNVQIIELMGDINSTPMEFLY